MTTPSLTKRVGLVETDKVFVDHTKLNVLERLFYPAISAPSAKIGRNKVQQLGWMLLHRVWSLFSPIIFYFYCDDDVWVIISGKWKCFWSIIFSPKHSTEVENVFKTSRIRNKFLQLPMFISKRKYSVFWCCCWWWWRGCWWRGSWWWPVLPGGPWLAVGRRTEGGEEDNYHHQPHH